MDTAPPNRYLETGPDNWPPGAPRWRLILAHGAGAGMDSGFLNDIAGLLADRGIAVTRFEFPYMMARRQDGKRRPPDRMPVLLHCWRTVIADVAQAHPGDRLAIGGKSMGGRAATLLAAEPDCPKEAAAVVTLGYPFHPPGKPEKLRVDHFPAIDVPVLMLQGTRDSFGTHAEVEQYRLPDRATLHWIDDGDHDLKPRKKSGHSHDEAKADAADRIKHFLHTLSENQ